MFGFLFHLSYVFELLVYLNVTFLWDWSPVLNEQQDKIVNVEPHWVYLLTLATLLIYPAVYDGNQAIR